jgi:hypothetical protein
MEISDAAPGDRFQTRAKYWPHHGRCAHGFVWKANSRSDPPGLKVGAPRALRCGPGCESNRRDNAQPVSDRRTQRDGYRRLPGAAAADVLIGRRVLSEVICSRPPMSRRFGDGPKLGVAAAAIPLVEKPSGCANGTLIWGTSTLGQLLGVACKSVCPPGRGGRARGNRQAPDVGEGGRAQSAGLSSTA